MTSRVVARAALVAALLVPVAVTSACGEQVAATSPDILAEPVRDDLVAEEDPGPFQVTAFVLEDDSHGPQLCAFAIATSLPPQCGGPDLLGWDFADLPADSYETVLNSRYGSFVVTGSPTEDGAIRLVGAPRPAGPGDQPESPFQKSMFDTPCPAPDGGWRPVDPARATDAALQAAVAPAEAVEGYGLLWVDQPDLSEADIAAGLASDPLRTVLNVSTTGDLAEMEAVVREVWGGALCVSRAVRSDAELRAARQRLDERADELRLLDVQMDSLAGHLTATALLARPSDQRRLDEEFGVGLVRLSSLMRSTGS